MTQRQTGRIDVAEEIDRNAARAAGRAGPCPCDAHVGCCTVEAIGRVGFVRVQRVTCRVCGRRATRHELMGD